MDKYEIGAGIINQDIIDYDPKSRFDATISISTIEHVRFDEPDRKEGKALAALLKIEDLLSEGGEALISVPVRYNPEIDYILANRVINFSKVIYMKKRIRMNLWTETDFNDCSKIPYNYRCPCANCVAFIYTAKNSSSPNLIPH